MDQSTRVHVARPHPLLNDAQGFATAILLVALGLAMLRSAQLLTGGIPGLAFLMSYATSWPLGWTLLIVNLPFIAFAWRVFGARFTWKTIIVVAGLSLGVEGMGRALSVHSAHPLFAAIVGGLLIGVGLLVLFRHGASLGGFGVLALFLQRRRGWRAGTVQMVCDAAIVAAAFALFEPSRVGYSIVSAVMVNLVLVWNHRPGEQGLPPRSSPAPREAPFGQAHADKAHAVGDASGTGIRHHLAQDSRPGSGNRPYQGASPRVRRSLRGAAGDVGESIDQSLSHIKGPLARRR